MSVRRVGERFALGRQVGAGGMGVVFQARDELTGEMVAVKLSMSSGHGDGERFEREARLLASLQHPNVVRYLAHGFLENGGPYLAMEWIEGEDLARRLSRGPLRPSEAATLGAELADALESAHRLGLVHRDVKPANVLLRNGRIDQPCLVDFGVARVADGGTLTRTGALIGTPGYMAPEQAGGTGSVGPRTDLFALGCVLYECVTGVPAFQGESVAATLAKILFAPAPMLDVAHNPEHAGLHRMLQQLLEKDPALRPSSAAAAAEGLRELARSAPRTVATHSVGTGELRVSSLWLAASPDVQHAATLAAETAPSGSSGGLSRAVGADILTLADGTLLGSIRHGGARDQARAVLQSALALRTLRPDLAVAVATGRASTRGDVPMGDAIDRAAAMLKLTLVPAAIRADEVTADLVRDSFSIWSDTLGILIGARAPVTTDRTRCIGRTRELAFLESAVHESEEELVTRVVLVLGAAGVGKSRLRRELLTRLGSERTILSAHCDPLSANTPFAMLSALLVSRGSAGDTPLTATLQRLSPVDQQEIGGALDALLSQTTAATRGASDPPAHEESRFHAACVRWLRAELELGPVILMLEDIQWADAASLSVIEHAAKQAAPLSVLGFARGELLERFPELFVAIEATQLRLGALSQKAATELAGLLLGAEHSSAIETLVARSQRHPMLLEELARAFRESGLERAHGTLEALLETRLLQLSSEDRRVLRAASIFGLHFPPRGVAALLDVADVSASLERATRAELISPAGPGAGDQCSFVHAMIREAAYAMLPDDDRRSGHMTAGKWLEANGERKVGVLAEHWIRGASTDDERKRAIELALAVADRLASRDASIWVERAETVAAEIGMPEESRRSRILLLGRQAKISLRSSRTAARAASLTWLHAAREAQVLDEAVGALAQLCMLAADEGQGTEAEALLAEARALAASLSDARCEAELANTESVMRYYLDDLEGSANAALQAAALSAKLGDHRVEAISLHNAADAKLRLDRFDDALELTERSERAAAASGLTTMHNDVLVSFIRALRDDTPWRESMTRSRARFEDGLDVWHALETRLYEAMLEAWLGESARAAVLFGELEQASVEHAHRRLADEARECRKCVENGKKPWFRGGSAPSGAR